MIHILGVRVDEFDMKSCQELIAGWIREGSHQLHQVVTVNPEGVWLARQNPELAAVMEDAALITPDGNGILWAAKRLGTPIAERVPGVELLENLCHQGAQRGWKLFFLGARPGVAAAAVDNLRQKYPGLQVVGCENGYFRDREDELLAQIQAAQPDLLFAALGMPFQELWLHQHAAELGCTVAIGVGGSFDVLSGQVRRAPRLWQRLKLEWLWRLCSDPKRWRRFLVIPRYMQAVNKEARRIRKGA